MTDFSPESSSNVLIMAGGTGGHIFPGLAVARELQNLGWGAAWLGSAGGMECRLVGKTDIPLNLISISGLRGNGLAGWLKAPFILLKAIIQAVKILRIIKPDVVIGFGGFASGPGGLAAFLSRVPLIIHEQNAVAGLTNKVLAKFSTQAFQAFPRAFGINKRYQTIGNPIRKDILQMTKIQMAKQKINLLVIGGSRGAMIFNKILPSILSLSSDNKLSIRHQCGNGNRDKTVAYYSNANLQPNEFLVIDEFIEDMADAYQWADIVICRSGALTVSEIAAVGVTAIFIPFPHAVDDHQTKNALWLVDNNAALMIKESDLQMEVSSEKILGLINSPDKISGMAANAAKVAYRDASQIMAEACELLMEKVA